MANELINDYKNIYMYSIREYEVGPHDFIYVIFKDGNFITPCELAKIYKPLQHYPFTDCAWANYHFRRLLTEIKYHAKPN